MWNIKSVALGAVAGLAVAGLCSSAGFAAPLILTWDTTGTTPILSTAGQFTFDNGTIQDFASASLTPSGAPGSGQFTVQEQGFLNINSFSLGQNNATPVGLNSVGGFRLYGAFTATATLICTAPNQCAGAPGSTFSVVNFTLLGNPGGTDVYGFDATTGNATINGLTTPPATDITLATGVLAPGGQNTGAISQGVPSAAVTTTFTPNPAQAGFFVSPPATMTLDLFSSFLNNNTEVTCYAASALSCTGVTYGGPVPAVHLAAGETVFYQIGNVAPLGGTPRVNPGGGSINFEAVLVPEPGSLSLLGIALLGFGALLTRRGRKGRVREA